MPISAALDNLAIFISSSNLSKKLLTQGLVSHIYVLLQFELWGNYKELPTCIINL